MAGYAPYGGGPYGGGPPQQPAYGGQQYPPQGQQSPPQPGYGHPPPGPAGDPLWGYFSSVADQAHQITFDDFVALAVRVRALTERFRQRDTQGTGHAAFYYDDFIQVAMSC